MEQLTATVNYTLKNCFYIALSYPENKYAQDTDFAASHLAKQCYSKVKIKHSSC